MSARLLGPVLLLGLLSGCGRLEEHVRHADESYRLARYHDVEEWLEHIEADIGQLDAENQAEFYFVRGMSAYRLGRRDEALHNLALAREVAALPGAGLELADAEVMARTLEELTPSIMTHHAAPAPEQDTDPAPVPAADSVAQ